MTTLGDPKIGTAREAVTWLGRAIHVGVARCFVRELLRRGWVQPGVLYGSAYSGIDTFAAALEAELDGDFEYNARRTLIRQSEVNHKDSR